MKQYISCLFLIFSISFAFAQNPDNSTPKYLPNSTPPSPEAFAITKYGDVPVDEFNGKVNLDIPIFEYTAGQLKLPISIGYYGAGVKLNELPTQIGIHWTLNAGGLISREVKGIEDETNDTPNLTMAQIHALNQEDCTPEALQMRSILNNRVFDKESDVFNFKFLSYSGSFFLDDNFNPVLTKNDSQLKIEIVGTGSNNRLKLRTNKEFIITTPDGIKYYFGGASASEVTGLRNVINGQPDLLDVGGTTSFFLYKIEHPVNGIILLEYDTLDPYHVSINDNYYKTRSFLPDITVLGDPAFNCPGIPETGSSQSIGETLTQNYIINQKLVKKIYSPDAGNDSFILFKRTNYSSINFKTVLNSIEFTKGSTLYSKADFEYIGLTPTLNQYRFFLSKVTFNNHTATLGNKKESYVFEYNDPLALPIPRSVKRDVLGYYNGKNNLFLFPYFDDEGAYGRPNRTGDLLYASKGTLVKVIYPTKGFSEFEYEHQPYVENKYTTISSHVYSSPDQLEENDGAVFANGRYTKLHDQLPKTITNPDNTQTILFETPILLTQQVNITLSTSLIVSEEEAFYDREPKVTMKITDLTTNTILTKQTYTSLTFMYEFKKAHAYKIDLDLELPTVLPSFAFTAGGTFGFDLHTGFHAPTGYGVRLKRTKNYTSSASTAETKRYYYKPYHRLNDIHADSFPLRDITETGGYLVLCLGTETIGQGQSYETKIVAVNTSTKNSTMDYLDNSFLVSLRDYNCVTVSYGGDNFENGGTEKTFALAEPNSGFKLNPKSNNYFIGEGTLLIIPEKGISSNMSPIQGQLIKEKVFANSNGLKKIKETSYTYESPITSSKVSFIGNKLVGDYTVSCSGPGGSDNKVLSNCRIMYYHLNSHDFKLNSQKTKEYIDAVPASLVAIESDIIGNPTQDDLEQSYKKIITQQDYEYGTLKGLPTKIKTTSSEGIINSTVNTYANQASSLTDVTPLELSAYAALITQNNVASPIQVQQYELAGSSLLSTQRTTFKQESTRIVPALIRTAKGTQNLEDRAVFEEYDAKGNPTLMSLKGGMKTKYLYNIRNQVIAKIENFMGTLEPNTKTITGSPCNFIQAFENSFVTLFMYDPVTHLLIETMDSNCRKTTYVYDALHRLQQIKDHDGNVVKEFDTNYKPQ